MASASAYDMFLWKQMRMDLLAYGTLIIFELFIYFVARFAYSEESKKKKKIINIIAVCMAIFVLALSLSSVLKTTYDVRNQAYITYEGTFYVSKTRQSSGVWIELDDTDKTHVVLGSCTIKGGSHTGVIVYSEKTRYVLNYYVTS